jgi:hypothetical protein
MVISTTLQWALQEFIWQLFARAWFREAQREHVAGITNG